MSFLRNRWYAAGWVAEFGEKPFARTILGEEITFYRGESGAVYAVSSTCPHRFAPMYYGEVVGENIKCRYHGLQFGPSGACVYNPDGARPPAAKLKSYPALEKDGMAWVWIGGDEPSSPPDTISNMLDAGYGALVSGYLHVECDYQLISDNLVDHSHAPNLHELLRTDAGLAHSTAKVRHEGEVVHSDAWNPDSAPSPFFKAMYDGAGNVDQWVNHKWQVPANITIEAGVTATGGKPSDGVGSCSIHLITPENETTSHYFWALARNTKVDDIGLSEKFRGAFQHIFVNEDKWMLEGQQKQMAGTEFWALRPVMLPQDKATGITRRIMDKLLAEQNVPAVQHAGNAEPVV